MLKPSAAPYAQPSAFCSQPAPNHLPKLRPAGCRHSLFHEQLGDLFGSTWTPYWKWREFIMGISWIAIMLFMKWLGGKHK